MIQSLLIANRGEIACRIIRTARAMGIRTVAVYSDADAHALHVRQADEAVHIGPSPARESYLVGEKIIAAAKATGAEAIHPGYGFLSENAAFAQAVIDAGLVWVGPKPASIEAMGLKDAAKALMQAAGVPVTPGYMGANQDGAFLAEQAGVIGYPVLIKAVAGGGGKGMRLVEAAADFADALASCQREASASFGNAHVLIEKYIQRPRHIEVQVFGDGHGNVVHLFERDCSLQRRHQKVIEEAPAPGMDEATREAICAAAVRAAKAVDYEGAGTIEFIADASEGLRADRIWFMEMNTRLQVEHPVTEEITGVDLVEWQLRVASGEPLPKRQEELSINGWAIEARLYAEDPATGFLPAIGKIDHLNWAYECRVETAVEEGDEISPFYDPMIAKLVAHGETRFDANDALQKELERMELWHLTTNQGFLYRLSCSDAFESGDVDTGYIGRNIEELTSEDSLIDEAAAHGAIAQALSTAAGYPVSTYRFRQALVNDGGLSDFASLAGFRLNAAERLDYDVCVNGKPKQVTLPANWRHTNHIEFDAVADGHSVRVGGAFRFHVTPCRTDAGSSHSAADGAILAPMPGKVIAVLVSEGQQVAKGDKLLTLEAMKMEHTLVAPFDGTVADLVAAAGAQVQVEAMLVRIEPAVTR